MGGTLVNSVAVQPLFRPGNLSDLTSFAVRIHCPWHCVNMRILLHEYTPSV